MREIIVTEFISLDGVVEAPGGEEDFKHTGWTFDIESDPTMYDYKFQETREAGAQAARPAHLRGVRGRLAGARGRLRRPVQHDAEVRRVHDAHGPRLEQLPRARQH